MHHLIAPDGTVLDEAETDDFDIARSRFWDRWFATYHRAETPPGEVRAQPPCLFFEARIERVV